MKRVLFLCGRNRSRSPPAERVFSGRPDPEVASAGPNPDADTPCTPGLLERAGIVFVMGKSWKEKLARRFGRHLRSARAACLDIPDRYGSMGPALVELPLARAARHLR